MKDIIVIDDVIPENYQKYIFDIVMGKNIDFPYYYYTMSGVVDKHDRKPDPFSLIEKKNDIGVFAHRLVKEGKNNSEHTNNILHPFHLFKNRIDENLSNTKLNIDFDKLVRLQANFITERKRLLPYHTPWHVDQNVPHVVMIYYVVDADGKTLFKNGKSVKPKRGRCVIFNGELEHSIQLSKSYRVVLNFNFLL